MYFMWLLYEIYIKYDSVIKSCVCTQYIDIISECTAYYRCIHQFIQITPRFRDYYKRSFLNALLIKDVYTNSVKLHLISVTVIMILSDTYS